MNKVTAYAVNAEGQKVSAQFVSYACDTIGTYVGAARAIQKEHGFLPRWNDEVTVSF